MGLCVGGMLLIFVSVTAGMSLLFCGFLVFAMTGFVAAVGSGVADARRTGRKRPADDGGSSELGFALREIRGDKTPFGQSFKQEP